MREATDDLLAVLIHEGFGVDVEAVIRIVPAGVAVGAAMNDVPSLENEKTVGLEQAVPGIFESGSVLVADSEALL